MAHNSIKVDGILFIIALDCQSHVTANYKFEIVIWTFLTSTFENISNRNFQILEFNNFYI